MLDAVKETKFCQGCRYNKFNMQKPGCEKLSAADFQELTLYPYSPRYEDKVTIKTYDCYLRDYTSPFPRYLELKIPPQ